MRSKRPLVKLLLVLGVFALVAAACGDDDDDTGAEATEAADEATEEATEATEAPAEETEAPAEETEAPAEETEAPAEETEAPAEETEAPAEDGDLAALGLWDDGPCDESLDPLVVGLHTVFASAVLTLEDQAQALEASAVAFNARGGANGSCIEVVTCDDAADPNQALACVDELDSAGVAVTVNDTTPVAATDVGAAYKEAGIPRFAISPGQEDYPDTNTYPFDGGGTGTTFMMVPPLLDAGITKIAIVRVDVPAAAALKPLFEGIFADNGAEFVVDLPVAAGTTDYSQFILAAQDAGAEGIVLPLGGQEQIQVLQAAQQLDADLTYSTSLGSLSYQDIASLGDYASHMVLNAAIPPATFDDPVVQLIASDLAASGVEALQTPALKSSPMRSWVGLYALLYLIRESGTDDFSRENMTALIEGAGPIPMLGLLAGDWTPLTDHAGAFLRLGQGDYSFWSWDTAAEYDGTPGNFVNVGKANLDVTICDSPFGGPCS